MLALFPEIEESTLSEEVLGELPEVVAVVTEEEPWTLYFDDSSTSSGGGANVVLINLEGQATTLSFKLDFPCTNNAAEYEAFIMGMSIAREMGVEKIKIIGDSNLVLSQLQGNFAVKEETLAPYRTIAEKIINSFKQVVMEHIPRVTNRYADALATLGSKLLFAQEQPNITVIKKDMPIVEAMFQGELLEVEDDWRKAVKEKVDLCPQGLLFGKHFEKLIQCDPRLNFLSQQPEIVLESPFFDARVTVLGDPDEYGRRFGPKNEEGPAIFGLQDSASPSGTHSPPCKDEQDFNGRGPENYSQEISSPSSVMDTPAIDKIGSFGAKTSKTPSNFNQMKVPGLPMSMSMSDFVSHIGQCIFGKISGKEQPSRDVLEEITQYLFNDAQLTLPSDEQYVMSRVNSLYCLL
ncbi:uncharacterized protein LOC110746291 [Prunus avium]|uniref:Uncharacterized protein LOC110746291 n=1 Tax=Prunus avium TaxID=42229 RepID=A0A6P5RGV5_PRUAV|nr:uncharacterized protein LOC110746291 [Prunus avium]